MTPNVAQLMTIPGFKNSGLKLETASQTEGGFSGIPSIPRSSRREGNSGRQDFASFVVPAVVNQMGE